MKSIVEWSGRPLDTLLMGLLSSDKWVVLSEPNFHQDERAIQFDVDECVSKLGHNLLSKMMEGFEPNSGHGNRRSLNAKAEPATHAPVSKAALHRQ